MHIILKLRLHRVQIQNIIIIEYLTRTAELKKRLMP